METCIGFKEFNFLSTSGNRLCQTGDPVLNCIKISERKSRKAGLGFRYEVSMEADSARKKQTVLFHILG